MSSFVLATTNEHKVAEMRSVLAGYDVHLLPRPSGVPDVEETDDTLEGNALLKARALAATGHAAIADDTGLFIDALGGSPGVYSARYAGEDATFVENVEKVLRELGEVDDPHRGARFRTVLAVAYPNGDSWWVEGVLEGEILRARQGEGGFGYDPIFAPRGLGGRSLGELSAEEKNALSHRGNALRAFVAALERS